ncbi:MAG: alpha-galactosidase, partial [Candidatus Latescibacteria bacterium]|nr:alpha-galactosidase [Candidatus Latescibacterota bacterium]
DDSGFPGPVCNRSDHGHAEHEGALAALMGKYDIWRVLHERYPDLVLENCGYPARLDYGLARYARAHWLSDDTTNALRCRQSQIHGSYVMPSAYNAAWVVKSDELDETAPDLLDSLIRSRMIGLFGMGTLLGTLPERVSLYPQAAREALKRNIAQYKQYRHLLHEDVYHLLPPSTESGQWDAIQFCTRDGSEAVLIVFRSTSPQAEQRLTLRGLSPDASYDVTGLNTGHSDRRPAVTLTTEGLTVSLPKPDTSEIYLFNRR